MSNCGGYLIIHLLILILLIATLILNVVELGEFAGFHIQVSDNNDLHDSHFDAEEFLQ